MPAIPIGRLISELQALYAPPFREPATWIKLGQVLREFAALPTVRKTSDLNPAAIASWISAHPGRRATTVYSLLRSLRSACTYARKMEYIRADPFDWRKPAEWIVATDEATEGEEEFDRHKSAAQVAKVLRLLDDEAAGGSWQSGRLQGLVYTFAFTGMRKREALGLLKTDVDLGERLIRIRSNRERKLKTRGSAKPLAIADELAAVLGRWLPRTGCEWAFPGFNRLGPWLNGGPGVRALDQIKAAGLRVGVPDLTMLSFRHTLATLADGWDLGDLELQRWLRHDRARTKDSYRKAADLALIRATAAKIRYGEVADAG